jgi:hypothetical protein
MIGAEFTDKIAEEEGPAWISVHHENGSAASFIEVMIPHPRNIEDV